MMRDSRFVCLPLLLFVVTSIITQAILAASLEERDSQAAPLDCVINPSVVADLGSGVPGILSEVRVDRSDFIEAGDVVAQLESRVEAAARDLAKVRAEKDTEIKLRRVNAAFGSRQHKRTENLFQRKVISTNDMDERKTEAELAGIQLRQAIDNREIASLELARAEEVLKRRTITSPISGVVMERFKTIGEYVDEQPVLRVAQLDPLHVEVFVPVEQLGDIRPGMHAEIWSDAVNGSTWNAKVTRVDKVADVASGTYGVRLVLPNPDYKVPAGLRCQLAFSPQSALPVAAQPAPADSKKAIAERLAKNTASGQTRTPPEDKPADGPMMAVRDGSPEEVTGRSGQKINDDSVVKAAAADAPAVVIQPRLAKNSAGAVGAPVDDQPIRDSTGEAPVIAAEPAEPVPPPLGGLHAKRTAEESAPSGIFDRIVAAVTGPPEADVDRQPVDVIGSRQHADEASGRRGGAASLSGNTRRTEINTRDALTGRIDLALPPQVVDEATRVCVTAGPFDNKTVATAQARRLRDAGLSAQVENRKTSVGIGYRVMSMAFDKRSDAKAVADRLKQAGIKDFYVAGSKRPFHVMLGSYSSAASAKRRIKQMAALGIEAQKQPWTREVDAYSLLVFGTPTADAQALLTQLPVRSDDRSPARCEQLAAR